MDRASNVAIDQTTEAPTLSRGRMISELYGRHAGADIYVIGTGTSMRVFPTQFFDDKITIGLNQAWQLMTTTYGITMMPKLNIPEFIEGAAPQPQIQWITKVKKVAAQCTEAELAHSRQHHYFFETEGKRRSMTGLDQPSEAGRCLDWVRTAHPTNLYLWTSISQSAANLAANMGAKNVILVGCDNTAIGNNHHAHQQHTMWKGEPPEVRYMQYYEGLAEVREALRDRGVNLVSLSPFLKLDAFDLDFERLCKELAVERTIENVDIPSAWTLREDNARYLRLTRYIFRKNLQYVVKSVLGRK